MQRLQTLPQLSLQNGQGNGLKMNLARLEQVIHDCGVPVWFRTCVKAHKIENLKMLLRRGIQTCTVPLEQLSLQWSWIQVGKGQSKLLPKQLHAL